MTATKTKVDAKSADATAQVAHDPAALRRRRESLGVSRNALAGLSALPLSRVWAAEQADKEVSGEHLALLARCLDDVQANGLPEDLRPRRAAGGGAAARRLHGVTEILGEARTAKTLRDVRALVERALAVASGEADPAGNAGDGPAFELVPEAATDAAPAAQAG